MTQAPVTDRRGLFETRDPRRLLDTVPVVSSGLWSHILRRYLPASVPYMRKLGVVGKTGTPCTTIDAYFAVNVSAPSCGPGASSETFVEFLQPDALGDVSSMYPLFPNLCPMCQAVLVEQPRSAQVVCVSCGESVGTCFPGGHSRSSNAQGLAHNLTSKRLTTYMYKRTNHFLDHLRRVQAKESTEVQTVVIHAVQSELAKEAILTGDPRITTTKIRSVLKKLRLQKYYNHVFSITARLSGRAAPRLTSLQEEKLLAMFQAIQEPFRRHCPVERTNMISYSYVLRKLVEILGWTHLIDYFPLLKSRQKVYNQDCIWRKICDDVGFPFYRSIA
jgi:hypothetical protein